MTMWAIPYSKEYQNGGFASAAALLALTFAVWFADVDPNELGIVSPNRFMKSVKFFWPSGQASVRTGISYASIGISICYVALGIAYLTRDLMVARARHVRLLSGDWRKLCIELLQDSLESIFTVEKILRFLKPIIRVSQVSRMQNKLVLVYRSGKTINGGMVE